MSALTTSFIVFGFIFGGVLLGIWFRVSLPEGHSTSESKEVVRLGMGLVGTMVALVLGLLITSSRGYYETQNSEVTEAAANAVLLDRLLAHYGPDAKDARLALRSAVARQVDFAFLRQGSDETRPTARGGEALFDRIQELAPHEDSQRQLQGQALGLAIKLGQIRWLMFEQRTSSVPRPLLIVLVFWLTLLFTSFGLFVRPNRMVVSSLFISAIAVSAAVFLILEMYEPYNGLIRVSSAPMRAALVQLGQ